MSDSSIRFTRPQRVADLKVAQLGDVSGVDETSTEDLEFRFFICQPTADGYLLHGQSDSALDAFKFKRELTKELGVELWIRAKRREAAPMSPDSDAAYEACKDYWNEGRSSREVPAHLLPAFRHFMRSHGRSAR